jgi:glycosyltransferase involved in cell wall biosynthesis
MHNKTNKIITIIVGKLPPAVTGGAEIFIFNLIREISKTRSIVLIGINDPLIEGVRFIKQKQIRPVRLFYPFHLFYLLCRSSRKSSAIYTSFLTGSWLLYIPVTIFSLIFRIPYSFTIHGGGLAEWKFKLPYILFFRKAKNITGVSYPICDEYLKRSGCKIKYLPPLLPFLNTTYQKDQLRSKYNLAPDRKIIIFVGSLKPLKNPLQIMKALNHLGKDFIVRNKLGLLYAGDGILKNDLMKYAEENGLSEFVSFAGIVPNEFVHEIYSLADLYVICSDYEGTPISLLEAMYHSLPVIASNAPGINSILTDNETALLYKTEESRELAAKLRQLLDDPQKANTLGAKAKIHFHDKFDYQKNIAEYIDIIEK